MITGEQIRAARALIDWTRDQLAEKCGLTVDGIKRIETNPNQRPHQKTLDIITEVFANHGIVFTPRGVERADDVVRMLEGKNAYMGMLDDILATTAATGGEVLWLFADDGVSRPGEHEIEQRIRDNGVRFRVLIKQGNQITTWPLEEYRQIPAEYFNHDLQVVYGDKVAQVLSGGDKIMIINNPSFATTSRNLFNMLWPIMRKLEKGHKP